MSLMTMEPCSGFSRPTSDFRKTDFPVPDGPSRTEISPGGRVRVTSLQMFWLPNDFDRFSTSTATPTSYLPLRSGFVAGSPPRRIDEPRQSAALRGRPHPDDRGPLLLVGNDNAGHRLRVSYGLRDLTLHVLARRGERLDVQAVVAGRGATRGPPVRGGFSPGLPALDPGDSESAQEERHQEPGEHDGRPRRPVQEQVERIPPGPAADRVEHAEREDDAEHGDAGS